MVDRIPVHIVTGAPQSGKTGMIAGLCAARGDWLGLVNSLPAGAGGNLRLLSAGCPCCTGKVVLQVSLARALRESRAVRAFVELPNPEHAGPLQEILGQLPLSLSVVSARTLTQPVDARIRPSDL